MFEHSSIVKKAVHSAHGFNFCIWVLKSMETHKLAAFISRLPGEQGDPVGLQSITADESFGAENLISQAISEIDANREQIYSG